MEIEMSQHLVQLLQMFPNSHGRVAQNESVGETK
jgi:hypothetical protein